ncbi:MAG: hypothetical protein U0869_14095 [Chloroflexota bacterium]
MPSLPVPSVPASPTTTVERDRLLVVADLLGAHPAGAVMCRLLGVRPGMLRAVVRGEDTPGLPADHLALMARFASVVGARLTADGAIDPAALARWRAWLVAPSLPDATGRPGSVAPIEALRTPAGVAAALADLAGPADERRGRVSLRLLSAVRPPTPVRRPARP